MDDNNDLENSLFLMYFNVTLPDRLMVGQEPLKLLMKVRFLLWQPMKKKIQIFIIHGGMTFKNDKDYLHYLNTREISLPKKAKWNGNDYIEKSLGKNFEIIKPRMPLPENARYRDWKIYFERYIPYLKDNVNFNWRFIGRNFLSKISF